MHYESIQNLSKRVASREVSPVEVVDACLDRIATLNPKLNAFITVLDEDARQQAQRVAREIETGNWRGALHGIPVAVKDFYDLAGVRTTAGYEYFRDRVPTADAHVVKKLKQAGAIIVGKTNMDALGMATTGLTSCFGPVRNPWKDGYVPGGSSAGSAAAVAAGLCYATVDTDAVGSVRLPAACCGVVGFKGSYDLISTRGILSGEPVDEFIRWMAHAGVTTRSAADTALILKALADPESARLATEVKAQQATLRIGVGNNLGVDAAIKMAFDQSVDVLRKTGHDLIGSAVPFWNPQAGLENIASDRADIVGMVFANVEMIVLPTLTSSVPTVQEMKSNPEGVAIENTAFANYYGLVAVTVPSGFDNNGMPFGLQFVGRAGSESTVLNVAHQYEMARDFTQTVDKRATHFS